MNRLPDSEGVWPWVRYFLEVYLPRHRGASPHTIASYRTAFRLLLRFLLQRSSPKLAKAFSLEELQPAILLEFLGWLESAKGRRVRASTRNCRLAALRTFFRFLELHRGLLEVAQWQRLRQLPFKRAAKSATEYLEPYELDAVFGQVPAHTPDGFRDLALLALLYNTGARAAEIAGARRSNLLLGELPSIRLICKGRRERVCPLWQPVAVLLHQYLESHRRPPRPGHEAFIFINQRRSRFTRYGVGHIVEKYLRRANKTVPSLRLKKLSAHSFRHTTAIHLLESGADINVIKAWLGHRSTESTSHYLDLSLESHRAVLENLSPPAALGRVAETLPPLGQSLTDGGADDLDGWLDKL